MRTLFFLFGIPFVFGTIIGYVLPNGKSDTAGIRNAIAHCSFANNRTAFITCIRLTLKTMVQREGIRKLMTDLDASFSKGKNVDPVVRKYCHDIAHSLGQLASETAKSPTEALLQCSAICGAGCYHGVVEGFLKQGGTIDESVSSLCSGVTSSATLARNRWACFHGLGHGIGSVTGDFIKSINLCDRIAEDDDKKNCDRGVLMELFESSSFDHAKLQFPDNAGDICAALTGVHREVCFTNAGLEKYIQTKQVVLAAAACQNVPKEFEDDCIGLLGNTTYHESNGDINQITSVCRDSGSEFPCIKGAVHEDVLTDPRARLSKRLCDTVPSEIQAECSIYRSERITSIYGAGGL